MDARWLTSKLWYRSKGGAGGGEGGRKRAILFFLSGITFYGYSVCGAVSTTVRRCETLLFSFFFFFRFVVCSKNRTDDESRAASATGGQKTPAWPLREFRRRPGGPSGVKFGGGGCGRCSCWKKIEAAEFRSGAEKKGSAKTSNSVETGCFSTPYNTKNTFYSFILSDVHMYVYRHP